MTIQTEDINKLADYIRAKGCCRIGIDGTNGAGKSMLARELATLLGLEHVNLDEYLDKKKGGFIDHLNYEDIKQKLDKQRCLIVEGVCLQNVLQKIGTFIECTVYVKRLCHGVWADEEECNIAGDVEEYIRREKETIRLIDRLESPPDSLGLAEEILRYHHEYRPHQHPEFVYIREDC